MRYSAKNNAFSKFFWIFLRHILRFSVFLRRHLEFWILLLQRFFLNLCVFMRANEIPNPCDLSQCLFVSICGGKMCWDRVWPNHSILFFRMVSVMVFFIPRCFLTFSFLILSRRVTPRMALRHFISKTLSFLSSTSNSVQVSLAYIAIGTISA